METPPPPPTDEQAADYPQKRFFRSRAHCNPLSHNDAAPYPRTDSAAVRAALATCCGSSRWVAHKIGRAHV